MPRYEVQPVEHMGGAALADSERLQAASVVRRYVSDPAERHELLLMLGLVAELDRRIR
ncbi:hypothetical protein [Frankia sp. Cr1]|uniref:hypothetical protein n=1 Tax=Frankia sp. Cr1 TaxID=3073931 RepID=UPI002AD495AD|nr:hypothetical protein [Frankia sp. Cr1]